MCRRSGGRGGRAEPAINGKEAQVSWQQPFLCNQNGADRDQDMIPAPKTSPTRQLHLRKVKEQGTVDEETNQDSRYQ
jgi:hypothetical protein